MKTMQPMSGRITRLFLRNLGISAVLSAIGGSLFWIYVRNDHIDRIRDYYRRLYASPPSSKS
jgi:hypothetical protein